MMGIARVSLETGLRSMDIFQQQAEKAIEFTMNNANQVQDETRSLISDWMKNMQKARKTYEDTLQQGLKDLEEQVSNKKKS